MSRAGGLVLVAVAAVGIAACGGGNSKRDDYVGALSEVARSEDPTATEAQSRCFAESAVEVVGVERLEDVASPDELREAGTSDLATLGMEISEAEGAEFYDLYSDCVDVRQVLVASAVGTQDISPDAGECLETELDEDLIRRFIEVGFAQGAPAALEDEELVGQIQSAFTTCTAAPATTSTTSPPTTAP